MNFRFGEFPIKRKILVLFAATSALVLVSASITLVATEYFTKRQSLIESNSVLVEVIAINSVAPMAFQDPQAADEVLSALSANVDVVSAQIYSAEFDLFAQYNSPQLQANSQVSEQEIDTITNLSREALTEQTTIARFEDNFLQIAGPILLDNRVLGVVTIKIDLQSLRASLIQGVLIAGMFLFIAFVLQYLLTNHLQTYITRPIDSLSKVMTSVSEGGDYSARAETFFNDELGTLSRGFNDMLGQIQQRDGQLDALVNDLKAAKDEAEAATIAKSRFLANMSHEIRTPMNGVLGLAHLLRETELNEQQRTYCETLEFSANSLLTIINDILDFSKIESGSLKLDCEEFKLQNCISPVKDLLNATAIEKGLVLETHIDEVIPEYFIGDSGRIRQILINLLGNAIKFTEHGSVKLSVSHCGGDAKHEDVLFEVADTGIGVPEHVQDAIFTNFSQGDSSTSRRFGGTGLGLSISKQLVELMGGKIGVRSESGKGSVFWFRVPLLKPERSVSSSEDALIAGGSDKEALRQVKFESTSKVLVAEDNRVNQMVLKGIMGNLGCYPEFVNNGAEAVKRFCDQELDLILMDIQMPGLDGIAATSRIRDMEKQSNAKQRIPIVALTANAMDGDRERYLEAGMDDYLTKPVRKEEVKMMLRKWLG